MFTLSSSHLPICYVPDGSEFSRWTWPSIYRASFGGLLSKLKIPDQFCLKAVSRSKVLVQALVKPVSLSIEELQKWFTSLALDPTLHACVCVFSLEGFVAALKRGARGTMSTRMLFNLRSLGLLLIRQYDVLLMKVAFLTIGIGRDTLVT